MRISSTIEKFQDGGITPTPMDQGMAAPDTAPMPQDAGGAPEGGDDPILQLAQMAQQALEAGDGQLALAVCEGFLQLVQQIAGG